MMERFKKYALLVLVVVGLMMPMVAEARGYRVDEIVNVQVADRTRFVSNPDGILSRDAVATLDSICYSLKERGLAEVAIVVVEDISPQDVVGFSQELFERWGVGDDELDNGLGVILVEDMHEIRFHTGYGLEGVLPDALCVRLQHEYMLPYFREGDYSRGMVEGMRAVDTLLSGGDLPIATSEEDEEAIWALVVFVSLCLLIPILLIVIHEYSKTKCPTCGKHKLRVTDRKVVRRTPTRTTIVEKLVCDNCHSEHTRTTDRNNGPQSGHGPIIFPMGGGGFGRGGFGGGSFGGGFGGGSFGGGGGGSRC